MPFSSENTSSPSPAPPPSPEQSARELDDSLNAAIATSLGIHKQFRCPKCGAAGHWGTHRAEPRNDPEQWLIGCHNDVIRYPGIYRACGWQGLWSEIPWQRFDADWAAFGELFAAATAKGWIIELNGPDSARLYTFQLFGPHGVHEGHASDPDPRRAFARAANRLAESMGSDAAARALGLAAGGEGAKP